MLKLALVAVLALAAAANAGSISDSCVVADGPYYQCEWSLTSGPRIAILLVTVIMGKWQD